MKKIILLSIFLLWSISIHKGTLDTTIKTIITYKFIIDYDRRVHDTIPPESIRLISNQHDKIEYWDSDSVIIHIDDNFDVDTLKIISWKFLTKINK